MFAVGRVLFPRPNLVPPLPLQDRRELEHMTKQSLIDFARNSGLTYHHKSNEMRKSDLEEHILKAQTFAACLRAKHPSSFERSASTKGDWRGFPGDYEILDQRDLETEGAFAGVLLTYYNR